MRLSLLLLLFVCLNVVEAWRRVRAGRRCKLCSNAVGNEEDCDMQNGGRRRRCRAGSACRTSVRLMNNTFVWNKGCKKSAPVLDTPVCTEDGTEDHMYKRCWLYCKSSSLCNRGTAPILLPCFGSTTTTATSAPCDCPDLVIASASLQSSGSVPMECSSENGQGVGLQNAIWPALYRLLWTNAEIPYVLDGYNTEQTAKIMEAIDTLNAETCLSVVPRTTQSNYVRVHIGSGCWSYIGMQGDGVQDLSLFDSNGGTCLIKGTIMHEFLHAAGFFHEQARPDRDDFVCVNLDNVEADKSSNFDKQNESDTLGTPYTVSSVMHYRADAFAIDPTKPTLFPKSCDAETMALFGQRDALDPVDIERVALLYQGRGSCPAVVPE